MVFILIFLIFFVFDLATKALCLNIMNSICVIPSFLYFSYSQNEGIVSRFGVSGRILIVCVSVLCIIAFIYIATHMERKNIFPYYSLSVITAGVCGNMIDWLFNGYVVNFFDFYLMGKNIFTINCADLYVVVGALCIVFWFVFSDKDRFF